ncbi:hypothetical protein [Albimonas pacifica]|uniref:17 kDa surface antigen n=1 Tax=Albimonas pacifica TaxID=1114924 RepID=A0A1I3NFY6_9RHOB|nr:hypothetical protein [Albimonas pacifica]SFJ08115.1 hypothetical protein SAMN05216258_11366 [Albimonas pacifica]
MRRLVLSAAAACLAASAAGAAPSSGAAPGAADGAAPALFAPLAIPGIAEAPDPAGEILLAKKSGKGKGPGARPGNRGGAPVRKPGSGRHGAGVNYKSGNNIVVNRGRPGYNGYRPGGGRYYYDDDDNDGLAGALVGGVIGLGVGAAIANSSEPQNTCVDNNGDGVCDAY